MKTDPLNNLRIASPCPINWEQMTGDERVRFCSLCNLHVYNISELTRKQATALISATDGRICGRIYRRADGTVITKDCPVGLRAIRRRLARTTGAVLATLVAMSSAAFGQKPEKKDACRQQVAISRKNSDAGDAITGSVVDPNGSMVANARIKITERKSKQTFDTTSDDRGTFRVALPGAGVYDVVVEAAGFKKLEITKLVIADKQSLTLNLVAAPVDTTVLVGYITLEPPPLIDTSKPGMTIFSGDFIRKLPIP